ncbi:MAG TPA: surface-adhesin E family protein [Thermodesulfobacteriota bacterium]|nr:surface-adhesin E family protein [Thermodesulfobacteriota bacterium]
MKRTNIHITFLLIGLAIFFGTQAWGVNWKYYGTNDEGTYYYDTETLTHLSKSSVKVCVQSIYTEKGVSHWVKDGGRGFQNLDLSLILSEYNCIDRSVRHLRIRFYSKDGEVFYPIKNDEWQLFAPDSMVGALFEEICKQ